uniref:ATP synthase F0 subunit 8 n=1 Tax=Panagrolaimus sp. PS1159 TaxID=55785 RepID=A0AC35F6T9_9BILA
MMIGIAILNMMIVFVLLTIVGILVFLILKLYSTNDAIDRSNVSQDISNVSNNDSGNLNFNGRVLTWVRIPLGPTTRILENKLQQIIC